MRRAPENREQLALDLGPSRGPRLVADAAGVEWSSGFFPPEWREGMAVYMPMARAPGDPERSTRKAKHAAREAAGRHRLDYEWRALRKLPAEEWARLVLDHLGDGVARTANRIGVELCDHTADVMPSAFFRALFDLAEQGWLEHTMEIPIFWRARLPSHDSVTMEPLPRPCTNPRCACVRERVETGK